ncbi:MAG: ATP-binding protein [Brevundimonas sp.]
MEAIGKLTGGVAHDFNNLLAAIMGSVELAIKRLPADPRVTPLLDNALQGARRGALLTQRMLAFARKQELNIAPVDVASLVRGMADFMERSLGPQIEVMLHFPVSMPRALADQNQLESALLNLMVNARDAMDGQGVITVSARCAAAGPGDADLAAGDYIRLEVADSGAGMDAATLARAHEPFFTTKGVGKGTGLGLSMAHGFAAQCGGRLEIASTPGAGTSVAIWLPIAAAAQDQTARPAPLETAAPSQRLKILVVDDDPLVLLNTVALLEEMDHEVGAAASAGEALDLLRTDLRFNLVLTDYAMPQMTGIDLAEAARQLPVTPPVGIMTGYADLAQGTTLDLPRLAKPFSQDELRRFVLSVAAYDGPLRKTAGECR